MSSYQKALIIQLISILLLSALAFFAIQLANQRKKEIDFLKSQIEKCELSIGDEWKEAVVNELVLHGIYKVHHDGNPRKAVDELLCCSNDMALEPDISVAAHNLVQRGRSELGFTITPLEEQQMFDDWAPYRGNPDPRTVWSAATEAINGLILGVTKTKGLGTYHPRGITE